MKIRHMLAAALLAGTAAIATPASALVTIDSISGDPGFLNGTLTYTATDPDRVINVGVGRIKLTGHDETGNVSYLAYCIDILHWLTNGTFKIETVHDVLSDPAKETKLLKLLSNADPLIALASNVTDKKNISAGIQLAVWEIVFEDSANPYNVMGGQATSGQFSATGVSSDAFLNATNYLGALDGWTVDPGYSLKVLEAYPENSNQNQLFLVFDPVSVPEPATWAMLIAGFGLVGGALRRRSREAALA